jgi:hypothetical protein
VNELVRPKSLSISQVDRYERVGGNFEQLFPFTGQPLSLVFSFPGFLVFFLNGYHILSNDLFLGGEFFKGNAGQHQMVLAHPQQQTAFTEVILHNEDEVAFYEDNCVVPTDLPKHLQYLLLRTLAAHQSSVQPF